MLRVIITLIIAGIYSLLSGFRTRDDLSLSESNIDSFIKNINPVEAGIIFVTDNIIIVSLFFILVLFVYFIGDSKAPKEFVNKFKQLNFKLLPAYQLTRVLSLLCWPMREIIPFNSLLLVPLVLPISYLKIKIIKSYLEDDSGSLGFISKTTIQIITITCSVLLLFLIPFLQSFIKKNYL